MTKTRLLFFGNERLSSSTEPSQTPLLQGLIAAGYDIAAVVVTNRPSTSRKQRQLEVQAVADDNNIPIIFVDKPLKKMVEELKNFKAEIAVLAAFGKIVPQSIIDVFPLGIINIHPSSLPEHRGPTPIETTMLSGQTTTAVSIMRLDAGMDTGPIFTKAAHELSGEETKAELTASLAELGAETLLALLPEIIEGNVIPLEQSSENTTYTEKLTKDQGHVDWSKPAATLSREIRAYAGWPGSTATIGDQQVTILEATPLVATGQAGSHFAYEKQLAVYCGEQALIINRLKPAGKQAMDGQSFMHGYLK